MAQSYVVTVGPLATADSDGDGLSQTAAAAQYLVINGALAAGTFSATSVCAAQTLGSATNLTINGSLATTNPIAGSGGTGAAVAATVRFPTPTRLYVTAAGNSSSRTITIVGTVQSSNALGLGVVVSETFTAPNTNVRASTNLYSTVISVSISGASTGNISVGHSGTSTRDYARRVAITSASNDTGITFTIAGTDWDNNPISEVLTGASGGTATSVLSYKTVTSVLTSGATGGAVEFGSSAVADSQWLYFDRLAANAQVAIQVEGSGTVNWTVSQTLDDITIPQQSSNLPTVSNIWAPADVKWVAHPDTALVGSTTTTGVQGNYAYTPAMARLTLNSGTGYARAVFIQSFLQ